MTLLPQNVRLDIFGEGRERPRIEAEIAKATDNLSYTTITSPIDGVVTRINAKEGELVMTGSHAGEKP